MPPPPAHLNHMGIRTCQVRFLDRPRATRCPRNSKIRRLLAQKENGILTKKLLLQVPGILFWPYLESRIFIPAFRIGLKITPPMCLLQLSIYRHTATVLLCPPQSSLPVPSPPPPRRRESHVAAKVAVVFATSHCPPPPTYPPIRPTPPCRR